MVTSFTDLKTKPEKSSGPAQIDMFSHPEKEATRDFTGIHLNAVKHFKDLTGQKFGRLTAVQYVGPQLCGEGTRKRSCWSCNCDCGKSGFIAAGQHLKRGERRSCGCLSKEIKERRFSQREREPRRVKNRPLYTRYYHSAKQRNLDFDLSFEAFDLLAVQNCHYCGSEPQRRNVLVKNHPRFMMVNGIDRIDSNKGYIDGNCAPCCKTCNLAKNTMTTDEFTEWIDRVYKHHRSKKVALVRHEVPLENLTTHVREVFG